MVEVKDVRLGNSKFPIQNIQKLALNPADITPAKGARHEGPVGVFQCGIVCVLGSKHEGAEEDTFMRPFLGVDG
jgi:hypothetical protein